MMLFRPACLNDLDDICYLAEHCGIGMTTLPNDRDLLHKRLIWSVESLAQTISQPVNEYYLFVLEDTATSQITGTSALLSTTGYATPFYSYKISTKTRVCRSLNIRNDYEILTLVTDNQGKSELCTLFLNPDYRHSQNGLLLSRARFLFMANFPQRFETTVIAEMRGVADEDGYSPFWHHVGQHFFHVSFAEADRLVITSDKQFINDLMPHSPIYIQLLDISAQAVLGKPHSSTVPAMNMLLREGFHYDAYVDIFDAGPTVEASINQIRTMVNSRLMKVQSLSDAISSKPYLISNTKLDFRAIIGQALPGKQQNSCIISKETARLLAAERGDYIRLSPLDSSKSGTTEKENT